MRGTGGFFARKLYFFREFGIDRNIVILSEFEKTLREIGIVSCQCRIDFALDHRRVDRARDRMVGKRCWVILRGK